MVKLLLLFAFLIGPQAVTTSHVQSAPTILPTAIANLRLWFSADCITFPSSVCGTPTTGSSVTAWADRSGNANNGSTSGTNCTYNASQINGKPAVTFDGVGCKFTLGTAITAGAGHTAFVVLAYTSTSGGITFGATSNGFAYKGGGSYEQVLDAQNQVNIAHGTATPDTSWHQMNVSFTNGGSPIFRLDESVDTTVLVTPSWNMTGNGPSVLGYNAISNAEYLNAKVAELIYYDRTLTSTEVGQIEAYLHSRYGL